MTDALGPELPGMRCVELLGSGGFSDVYLYEQDHPRLKLAVKLLKTAGLTESQREQFVVEANIMAELSEHPYIVSVQSAGTSSDGRPYLVMPYYPPPDLGERVAQEPLSVKESLRLGVQLASAVESAHRAGIIHRDIKPANVLISSFKVPGLADFGIAGRGERSDDENVGVSMPWSPPEVLAGRSNGSVASDVYSLAATIWNLLVGRSPFSISGDNSQTAMFGRIMHGKVPATGRSDVPASLDKLLQQAMAKDPAHRPKSALEFARHLRRVEQEMRLTPTEIPDIVDAAPAKPAATSSAGTGASSADLLRPPKDHPTDGQTMRRPRSVAAQEIAAPTPQRETTLRSALTPVLPGEQTVRRPKRVEPATASDAADVRTPRAEVSAGASETERISTPGRLLVGGVIAVLLVTIVGVGLLLSSNKRGSEPPPKTPPAKGSTTIDDVAPGLTVVVTPPIVGAVSPGGRQVTFSAVAEHASDVFQWQAHQPGETYKVLAVPPDTRTISIEAAGPGRVCATLMVRRTGSISDPGERCVDVP